jgi:class 3 adenylate cyclase
MNRSEVEEPTERTCIIVVVDILAFNEYMFSHSDVESFRLLDAFFITMERCAALALGRVVKLAGDAALMLFPPDDPGAVVNTLRDLVRDAGGLRLSSGDFVAVGVRAHITTVVEGTIGTLSLPEVVGRGVNDLFRLPAGKFVLSAALQNALTTQSARGDDSIPTEEL